MIRCGAERLLIAVAHRESTESAASLSWGVTALEVPPPPPVAPLGAAIEPDPNPDRDVRSECPDGVPGSMKAKSLNIASGQKTEMSNTAAPMNAVTACWPASEACGPAPPDAEAASLKPMLITMATAGVSMISANIQRIPVQNQRAVASATRPAARMGMVAAITRMEASRTRAAIMSPMAAGSTPSRAIRPRPTPETPLTAFCHGAFAAVIPCQESAFSPAARIPRAAASAAVTSVVRMPSADAVAIMYWAMPLNSWSSPPPPVIAALPSWMKASSTRSTAPTQIVAGITEDSGPATGSRLGTVRWSMTPRTPLSSEREKSQRDFMAWLKAGSARSAREPPRPLPMTSIGLGMLGIAHLLPVRADAARAAGPGRRRERGLCAWPDPPAPLVPDHSLTVTDSGADD